MPDSPMPDSTREQRLRELFDRAVSLAPSQREPVIEEAGDELLAERLRAMLAQDALGTVKALQRPAAAGLQALRRIGPYELLRELGSGGMGTVFLARQVEPVERLVALKMIQRSSGSKDVEQRFAIERQALALMNHSGIAHIFDAGTTDDGAPYFVMEYVRGEPITDYCDRRRLDCRARIELFREVCDALHHAHQKAVLHRDLKPGNVLVTEEGGSPLPKIIDFGVARALGGALAGQGPTSGGLMIGTFVYMSPEQADPSGQDVDTRSDIYSLGVLLYELLTGELPLVFDAEKDGIVGFQRILLETTPPRASARVEALPAEQQAKCARNRGTTAPALSRGLRGDLDWILLRALEKDRNRRYASATDFAADLLRHRQDEPVLAGPPTMRYVLAKFVRRHRLLVLAAALLVLGLSAGIVGATYGMVEATAAHEAEAEARQAQARQLQGALAVSAFFDHVLSYGDPGMGTQAPSLRQVLDGLVPSIGERWGSQPIDEAAVRAAVGRIYLAMGESGKAEAQLRRAWDLVDRDGARDAAFACMVLYDLSRARRLAGGAGVGNAELARMLELGTPVLATHSPAVAARCRDMLGLLREQAPPWPAVQARCDELLAALAGLPANSEGFRLGARLLTAIALRLQEEELPGSGEFLDRVEAVVRHTLGADVDFLPVLLRFAEKQLRVGRFAAAHRLAAEALGGLAKLGIADHWLQLRAERIRGLSLVLTGEVAAGETALVQLQRRASPLPPTANEQVRAAANVLTELCERLAAAGQIEAFFAASLQRWQLAAGGDPSLPPWWPADVDGLPAAPTGLARAAVEQAIAAADSPLLQALHGALLLRADQPAAAAVALEAALAAVAQATPELQADAAIVRTRLGKTAEATALAAALRARCANGGAFASRCQRALQRVADAGLR